MDTDSIEDQEKHYFAKFLTNQKLLELQLSDSNFRRYILVQFIILFQYLQSSVKFKMLVEFYMNNFMICFFFYLFKTHLITFVYSISVSHLN